MKPHLHHSRGQHGLKAVFRWVFVHKWPRNKLVQFLAGLYCSHCICICILFSFGQLPSTVVYLYLCLYLDACICIFIIYISFLVACWPSCFVSFLWRPRLNWDFSTIAGNKIYGHLDLQPSVARREQKYKRHILLISLLVEIQESYPSHIFFNGVCQ